MILGEWTPSIGGVAVPVDDEGLVLSISAGGASMLLSANMVEELSVMMRDVRRDLERVIGRLRNE